MNSNPEESMRIVIVEDNRYVRSAWAMAMQTAPDFVLAGSYGSCEEAFQGGALAEADLVLMDIGLPGMSGIEGVRLIKARYPHLTVVMCTVHDDDAKVFDALCAGAVGYLLKNTPPAELIAALREAYKGGSPMTPSVARKVIASFQKPPLRSSDPSPTLTAREQEVLEQMAQGKSYSSIADQLFLSVDGVSYHIRHIYEKLQVHSRAEAVAEGIKKRFIRVPR
ncbi:MAG TPA: response regulator transcription factor [Bacteroidota bacterium]|nr:response regulator transcription factor [Bacteroidota bacterium]